MEIQEKIKVLKALADKTRLGIILTLLENERSVGEIVNYLKKPQPTISIGLRILEQAGIIKSRREAKFIFYSIKNEKIKNLLSALDIK